MLGEDAPKSLADFQEIKYNHSEEWVQLKELVRYVKSQKEKYEKTDFLGKKDLSWHWNKHQKEFPNLTEIQYRDRARKLLIMPLKKGVLEEIQRADGSIARYYYPGNEFIATTNDGEIRTFLLCKKTDAPSPRPFGATGLDAQNFTRRIFCIISWCALCA